MVLAVAGPGVALQRWLKVRIDPALVLPLGMAYAAGAAWLGIASGRAWAFPLLILVADLGLARPGAPWRLADGPTLRGALPPFAAIVAGLALLQYPLNRRTAGGDFGSTTWRGSTPRSTSA